MEHSGSGRKKTGEKLRESERKYRTLIENIQDGIYILDSFGKFTFVNEVIVKRSGYPAEWFLDRSYLDIISEKDREHVQTYLDEVMEGKTQIFDLSYPVKSGNLLHLETHVAPIFDGAKVIGSLGVSRDITERKLMEETLRESEEKYRTIVEESFDGLFITSPEGKIIDMNKKGVMMFGYDTKEEILSLDLERDVYANPSDRKRILLLVNTQGSAEYEVVVKKKNGETMITHCSMTAVKDQSGVITSYRGIIRDISERKRAEAQLHASLREKELLLRELHHRVKNNMQVISGLLDLPAALSGNQERRKMFHDSQSRIHAMSLVHEKLYGSKDFARIDLVGYVNTLSQDLFQTYKINPGKIDLIIQTDGDVYVDINKAIPCGLILNELISNALKHAFPGDRHGELQIIIRETKNTEIEIIVRDNGLGLPDEVDIHQPGSVGLHLVNGLVKNQIDGQIEIRRNAGTEIWIKFPL